jgi:hypothetical protein
MKWTIDAERALCIPPKKNIIGKPIEYNRRNTDAKDRCEKEHARWIKEALLISL